jgi:hypothetical protein
MVAHGRGIGPFDIGTESRVPGREAANEGDQVRRMRCSFKVLDLERHWNILANEKRITVWDQ